MNRLKMRFAALWTRSGGAHAEDVYAALAQCYAEPARHYHTLRHVRRCLRHLDLARGSVPDPDAVELALWCHDVIYVPGARDNERSSADWFRHRAESRIAACDRICAMILATTHVGVETEPDTCFVCDIDLAVLGLDACGRRDRTGHLFCVRHRLGRSRRAAPPVLPRRWSAQSRAPRPRRLRVRPA